MVSGKLERGVLKQGDKCTIVGHNHKIETQVSGMCIIAAVDLLT